MLIHIPIGVISVKIIVKEHLKGELLFVPENGAGAR